MPSQAAVQTATNERPHAWVYVPKIPLDGDWEYRDCPHCGLQDSRAPSFNNHNREWRVTTPCIIPVPENLTFDTLCTELKEHGRLGCERNEAHYNLRPYVMGWPGKWSIGFIVYGEGGKTMLVPDLHAETLEQGWALLLRWLRAREYSPEAHRHYESTNVNWRIIKEPSCPHDDDDD